MAGATKCPKCKDRLVQRLGDTTRVRVEGPIEFDEHGTARGTCYWCKSKVILPLRLTLEAEEIQGSRFIVRGPTLDTIQKTK